MCAATAGFVWVVGTHTQVLQLAEQALHPPVSEHLPALMTSDLVVISP